MLLGLIPALSFLSLTLLLANLRHQWGWRRSGLRAAILIGSYAVLTLELLSLFKAVSRLSLIIIWLLPLIICLGFLLRRIRISEGLRLPDLGRPTTWIERLAILGIVVIVVMTGIVAWYAAPNTYDSLTYHMSRVAHWAQEGGVRPYASGILRQNFMSPGAEMGILHLYVLGQGDRWANFIQWTAMLISLVGVSSVASDLGGDRKAQIFAMLFTVTLPMGIAQSSSTMTDYVAALWVLLAAGESLRFYQGDDPATTLPLSAASAGLAILAKPTAVAFLFPFMLLAFVQLIRKHTATQVLKLVLIALMIVLVINLGYLARNWLVFGNLLGGEAQAQAFTNAMINLRVLLSNLLRNASLHAGTPWPIFNEWLYTLLAKVHWKLDLGLDDARTSMHPFFTIWDYPPSETHATNTVQAVIILLAVVLVSIRWKRFRTEVKLVGGMTILGFILFSSIFKFDILGSRYHMPFFVLAAPFVAVVFAQTVRPIFLGILILGLLIGASPILLSLENRPLIPTDAHGSVFSTRRLDQYFFESPNLDEPYILITEKIEAARCNQVGLILKGDTAEYLLWVLLDAPREELTVDWIISTTDISGAYRLAGFQPCAVICEGCGLEGDRYNELPLVFDKYGYRLYLSNNP